MPRISFVWKLYLGIVTAILLSAVIVFFFVSYQIENDTFAEIRSSLRTRAELLRIIASPDLAAYSAEKGELLEQKVGEIAVDDTRLTLILTDGTVVADSREDPRGMDNHAGRPEIQQARAEGVGTSTRRSTTLNRRMLYLAVRIRLGGETVGFARTSLPLTGIDERLVHLRNLILLGVLISALVMLIPGFFLARQISRPLAKVTEAAERIAEGEYGEKLWRGGSDEISKLARAFDSMNEQLNERMDTITIDRNKLLTILSSMVEGVIAVDRDERIVHINLAAAEILNTLPSDAVGKHIWEVTRIAEILEAVTSTVHEGERRAIEARLVEQRSDRVIELHASPLRNAAGGVAGAVLVLYDVTEIRRLATVRQDFIANVSHELKTPLTAIRGILETLLDDGSMDPARQRRFLERLEAQSARMSNLIADIISLANTESKDLTARLELIDFRQPVRDSFEALRAFGEQKDLSMEIELPDESVPVHAEAEALRRAVDNLIDNAIKYTDHGGEVGIRVFALTGNAVLEVKDNGIGIEPRDQERVFERFYRIDKARSRELGGSGLGLSIVKRTAMAFGGDVSLTSLPGKGSTFHLRLPKAPDAS